MATIRRLLQLHKFTWIVAVVATGAVTWANSVPQNAEQLCLKHGSTLYTLGWPTTMVEGVLNLWSADHPGGWQIESVEQWRVGGYAANALVALAIVACCAGTTEFLLRRWRAAIKIDPV